MAKNKNRIPSINTGEIIIEGNNNNTTARVTFDNNKLKFTNVKTGEDLLSIDALNNSLNFSDGSSLTTATGVVVRDFDLKADSQIVIYKENGQPDDPNAFITINAVLTGLTDTVATFTTEPAINLVDVQDKPNTKRIDPASFANINFVTITAEADEFSESIVITKLSEGSSGFSFIITNPSDILATDQYGTVIASDLLNTVGQAILYRGTTNLTAQNAVAYSLDDLVNVGMTIDPTTGVYQVTSFSNNATRGSATIVANYDGTEFLYFYKIVKAKAGATGDTGNDGESPYVALVTDQNIFVDTINNDNVANINPSAVTDLGNEKKITSTIGQFELYRGTQLVTTGVNYYAGETGTNSSESKNNLTFTIDSSTGAYFAKINTTIVQEEDGQGNPIGWNTESETFTVRAVVNTVTVATRTIKIQKAKIGLDGQPGPTIKLLVTPNLFRFNGEGVPTELNQQIQIQLTTANMPEGVTNNFIVEPSSVILGGTGTSRTLSIADFIDGNGDYVDYATITGQVLLNGEVYLEDPVTVYRTQNGTDAKSIVLTAEPQYFTFDDKEDFGTNSDSVRVFIKTQNLLQDIDASEITITKKDGTNVSIINDDITKDGSTFYFDISLNDGFPKLSVTNTASLNDALPVTVNVTRDGVFDILTIQKLVGGTDALNGWLDNEADQIPAFADGTTLVDDYSTLNGQFYVYKGIQDVTASATFSVEYQENMEVEISSTGFYSVVIGTTGSIQGADVSRAVLQASYGDSYVRKVFTVTKVKQGRNSLSAVLSNETHTIRADDTGTLILTTDLGTAGGQVLVYDGDERVDINSEFPPKFYVMAGDPAATTSGSLHNENGLSFNIDEDSGVYSLSTNNVSSWTSDTEVFYIKIVYKESSIQKTYTITKSKGGRDAKIMILKADKQVFTFNSDYNASPTSQTVIFTADPTNMDSIVTEASNITWSVTPPTLNLLKDLDPIDIYKKKIEIADFKSAGLDFVKITAEAGGSIDDVTIVTAKDGAAGETAKTLKLTSTENIVKYENKDSTTPEPEIITFFVNQQNYDLVTEEITDLDITILKNGSQTSQTLNDLGVSLNDDLGSGPGDKTFDLTIGQTGAILTKADLPARVTLQKGTVKDFITIYGVEGGSDAATIALSNPAHVVPAESNGYVDNLGLSDAGGIVEVFVGATEISNTPGQTDNVLFSLEGGTEDVVNNLYYINNPDNLRIQINKSTGVYSLSNVQGSSWSDTLAIFNILVTLGGVVYKRTYTISKATEGLQGLPGDPSVNGVLSNESATVVADEFGVFTGDFNKANGSFFVYRGTTDITSTSDVSFVVIGGTGNPAVTGSSNGLRIIIEPSGVNKGKYTLSEYGTQGWTSDSETFILEASVVTDLNSTSIQKAYTITKAKGGDKAKYVILNSTKQTFDRAYSGETPIFAPSNQQINFTASLFNLAEVSPTYKWYVDDIEVTDGSYLTVTGDSASMNQTQFLSATSNATNLSTTVKFEAIYGSPQVSVSDQITVILNQQGKDGASGTDGKTVKLQADDYQIAYTKRGQSTNWNIEPTTVNLAASAFGIEQNSVVTYKFYVNGTLIQNGSSNTFVLTGFESTFDTFVKRSVKVEVIDDGELVATDTVDIFATRNGSDAVTINMPNNNHTFPSDEFGVVDATSYSTGTTQIEVYLGNDKLDPVATSVADGNMQKNTFKISSAAGDNITAGSLSSVNLDTNNKIITTAAPSAMSNANDTAHIDFIITVKDDDGEIRTFLQKQTFTKSKRGEDSQSIIITPDSNNFTYTTDAGNKTTKDYVFVSIKQQNLSSAIVPSDITITDADGNTIPTPQTFVVNSVTDGDGEVGFNIKIDSINSNVNYANSDAWIAGSGTGLGSYGGNFVINGLSTENIRAYRSGPFSDRAITWEGQSQDSTSNDDGGWNKDMTGLNANQLYRSTVWVKRTSDSTVGQFYHGCGQSSNTYTLANVVNTNPYFAPGLQISILEKDVWYLSVGYIHANNDPSTSAISTRGLYSITGEKVYSNYPEFKMAPGATTQRHRTYLYYSTDVDNAALEWWGPRFEAVDGTEPSVEDLLNGYGYAKQKLPLTISVTKDGITSTTTIDKTVGGNDGNEGSIFDFTKVITDPNGITRAWGWVDSIETTTLASSIPSTILKFSNNFTKAPLVPNYSTTCEVEENSSSKYGGNLLKLTTSATANSYRIVTARNHIPVDTDDDFNFRFRLFTGLSGVVASPVLFFYDANKNPLTFSGTKIKHQYTALNGGSGTIEKAFLYDAEAASNTSATQGFPADQNAAPYVSKFPAGTKYIIPGVIYSTTTSGPKILYLDLVSFEKKKVRFTDFFDFDPSDFNLPKLKDTRLTTIINDRIGKGETAWDGFDFPGGLPTLKEGRLNGTDLGNIGKGLDAWGGFDFPGGTATVKQGRLSGVDLTNIGYGVTARGFFGTETNPLLRGTNTPGDLQNANLGFTVNSTTGLITMARGGSLGAITANPLGSTTFTTTQANGVLGAAARGFFNNDSTPLLLGTNTPGDLQNANLGFTVANTGQITMARGGSLGAITANPLASTEYTGTKSLATTNETRFTGGVLNVANANDALKNVSITVDPSGILQGIGTANIGVDVNQAGQNSLVAVAGMLVIGNTIKKVSGGDIWAGQVSSNDGYTGGAQVSFTVPSVDSNQIYMIGLSSDPLASTNYTNINWALYVNNISLYIYESGVYQGLFASNLVAGDSLAVTYDGDSIRYWRNGSVIRTVTTSITAALYLDSSFYRNNAIAQKVVFRPGADVSKGITAKTENDQRFTNGLLNVNNANTSLRNASLSLSTSGQTLQLNGGGGNTTLSNSTVGLGSVENKSSSTIRGEITINSTNGTLNGIGTGTGTVIQNNKMSLSTSGQTLQLNGGGGNTTLSNSTVGLGNVANQSPGTIRGGISIAANGTSGVITLSRTDTTSVTADPLASTKFSTANTNASNGATAFTYFSGGSLVGGREPKDATYSSWSVYRNTTTAASSTDFTYTTNKKIQAHSFNAKTGPTGFTGDCAIQYLTRAASTSYIGGAYGEYHNFGSIATLNCTSITCGVFATNSTSTILLRKFQLGGNGASAGFLGGDITIKQSAESSTGNAGVCFVRSGTNTARWNIQMNSENDLYFSYGGTSSPSARAFIRDTRTNGALFTGQHRNISKDKNLYDLIYTGLIVVSNGFYKNIDGYNSPSINESLPEVSLSTKRNQKSVWGVISNKEDQETGRELENGAFVSVMDMLEGDERLIVNSVGEGAIWVCNINGNLENGDYITTCEIPGFGMKQDDDLLHNYTVAKITCDCDFNLESPIYICEEFEYNGITYRKAFVGCTYHCG